jgi:hypothetical protein
MKSLKNRFRNNSHINFAKNCMIELLSKRIGDGVSQITSDDLNKINTILNKYKIK